MIIFFFFTFSHATTLLFVFGGDSPRAHADCILEHCKWKIRIEKLFLLQGSAADRYKIAQIWRFPSIELRENLIYERIKEEMNIFLISLLRKKEGGR